MVTLAARADTLNRVTRPPEEEVQWYPGCNCTRTLDHFTPLSIGVPYYRPYCNQCVSPSPHRRVSWFHPLINTLWTALRNLAVRVQTGSDPKKAWYGAKSAAWLLNPAPGVTAFVRLGDGLLIDMSSLDARRLLACLQACEGTLKQQGEITPDR